MRRGCFAVAAPLLVLMNVLTGCTTVRTVDFSGESISFYRITMADGNRSHGSDVVRTPDSTLWTDGFHRQRVLANSDVISVEKIQQPKGRQLWMDRLAAINKRAAKSQASVTFVDGTSSLGQQLQVRRDSMSWIDVDDGESRRASTATIATVTFADKGRGAMQGFGIGTAAGAIVGIVSGLARGDDPPGEGGFSDLTLFGGSVTAGQKAVWYALLYGGVGASAGALIGSRSKATFTFRGLELPDGGREDSAVAAPGPSPAPDRHVP